jgi:protein-glutamine gamma-glutamyltransferase
MIRPESLDKRQVALGKRLWQRRWTAPAIAPEESGLLRALTQAMVLVGIAATDVAASTDMSLWAIPLSIVGASWSWRRRHRPNTAVKFILAILMLLALGAFFVGLRGELNDTRLVLVELLVQLQVLHTFDLPRRKDLGYSMVIGLILIGVASTLSQTMVFGLFLLVFLAIALPVLILDYRSRIGLLGKDQAAPFKQAGLDWKKLSLFFLVIVSLGLTVFAFLPRLPGYQVRTFPMSAPLTSPAEFDNRQVLNPGYVRPGNARGEAGGNGGASTSPSSGAGQMDDTFYYGFNSKMNQNLRGQLKPKAVMRVRSQVEGFWRVLAFDKYGGQGWEISRNERTTTVSRPAWSYQFYLPPRGIQGRSQEVIQTYTVLSDLPNLVPALATPAQLYFPTQQVAVDTEGSVRSPLGLREGMTYTVVSQVPYRDRTLLRAAATDYGPSIRQYYLDVPPAIVAQLRQETERLLATATQPVTSNYETSLFLAQKLKQTFTRQDDLPSLAPGEDLVTAFLFKYKGGYPDHFSTTLTMMLRSIGIPARLAAGYGAGEFNPFTGLYVVRNTDAYAVTEVYFPQFGWFGFDPIPGHEVIPPSVEDAATFTVLEKFWKWVAGWLPSPLRSWFGAVLGGALTWILGAIAWLVSLVTQSAWGAFVGLLGAIGLGFLGWILWRSWGSWRYHRALAKLLPMERIYRQMVDGLAAQGVPKRPAQTPQEYADQVRRVEPQRADVIAEISEAYVQWRYGGRSANIAYLKQRLRAMQQVQSAKRQRSRFLRLAGWTGKGDRAV